MHTTLTTCTWLCALAFGGCVFPRGVLGTSFDAGPGADAVVEDSSTQPDFGVQLDSGQDNDAWAEDAGVQTDAWTSPPDDAWIAPVADAGTDAAATDDAWTTPPHCDADELLDAPSGRCWSFDVIDGVCPPGREVGWWTTTAEQARVQTLMATLTSNTLVNTALIHTTSGAWVWNGHPGVTAMITWRSPHPLATDRHAALTRTSMTADSFSLAAGSGTLCVRPGT